MTIPDPIETSYRGHRFRSRLEAKWAVAFDHLGVQWKYEPQGYHVGHEARRVPAGLLAARPRHLGRGQGRPAQVWTRASWTTL